MRAFSWNLLLLLWTLASQSLVWSSIPEKMDVLGILSKIYGSVDGFKNICDVDNKWWEISLGADPFISGVRVGKHDTPRRNNTWFSFSLTDVQMGMTTTRTATTKREVQDFSHLIDYLHKLIGSFCTRGTVPLTQLQSSPVEQCAVTGGVAHCPENDDWNRDFIWAHINHRYHMTTPPFGFEVKTKPGQNSFHLIAGLKADNQHLDLVDILIERKYNFTRRIVGIPALGLTAIRKYAKETLRSRTIQSSECTVSNAAGRKILRHDTSLTSYDEPSTNFYDFSFGVPYQDGVRKQAIENKFDFVYGAPKVTRHSLYKMLLVGKEFMFRGNETYNEWDNGAVERWKFVNVTSPLMNSEIKIDQIYIYHSATNGYEVAKGSFPFADIAVTRQWGVRMDRKTFVFNFNPNSIIPTVEITYTFRRNSKTIEFKLPSSDYGICISFNYYFDSDSDDTVMWSVTRSDLKSNYKNKIYILSGHIQRGAHHVLMVFKKNPLFISQYTSFLDHLYKLVGEAESNYGEFIYSKIREEIGEKEIDNLLFTLQEMPTLRVLIDALSNLSILFDPRDWQQVIDFGYMMLERYGKVEDTETEFIFYCDLKTLPITHLYTLMEMFTPETS